MNDYYKEHRFMFLRRLSQITILFLFFGANYYGWTILKGNLSMSILFSYIPLSDPFAVLQMFFAGAFIATDVIIGALIVFFFYFIVGGRAFCAWVCPVNLITDLAAWLRGKVHKYDHQRGQIGKNFRYWFMGMTFFLCFVFSITAFEVISPISIFHRGIIFGFGFGWIFLLAIFFLDLLVQKHAWCGHMCPLGGFYNIIGKYNAIKVDYDMQKCIMCSSCLDVCPEKQVLYMIGKEEKPILDGACIKCGRCVEVCKGNALNFSIIGLARQKKAKR